MDIPKELEPSYKRTIEIFNGFIRWLSFCIMDTQRNPKYIESHLLSVLADDYMESLVSVPILVEQGIHRPVIREARFILETSIKLAYIQQNEYALPIEEKLDHFKKILNSTNISIMKDINFRFLNEDIKPEFFDECGRLFGYSSKFVHLTTDQILSRLKLIQKDNSIGKESSNEIDHLNDFLERIYSVSIVFMMHSVPTYISGDWLVEGDGSSIDWCFLKSKFIASIDEKFDYKHERKENLKEIIEKRQKKIKFRSTTL